MPEAPAIYSSRPTIVVDGREDDSFADGLTRLTVSEDTQGLYRCEATFGNWGSTDGGGLGYLYFDRSKFDFGKSLQIKLRGDALFDGRITALEARYQNLGPRELAVFAEDRFQDLRMTRRTRTFSDVTDSDVFSRVASDHALTPDISVNGPSHKVLSQINQSDLAFLRERARACGAEVWVDGTTLRAKPRTDRNGGSPLKLTYGADLLEFSALADLAHQRTSVFVNGWDVAGKKALQYEATDSVLGSELNGDRSGASILNSAFGQRKEALAHTVPLTAEEAQASAESFFRTTARRFVVGRGLCITDARVRVGATVELEGLGPLFNGKFYVSEVRHTFDFAHGLRTAFTAERPGLGH